MSLILEALKKLDKEREAQDRGFLVMTPATWGAQAAGFPLRTLSVWGVLVMASSLVGIWLWPSSRRMTPREATTPAPQPAPTSATPSPAMAPLPVARSSARPPAFAATEPAVKREAPRETPAGSRFAQDLRLQAISQKDGHPVAILNERLVREGDMFEGVRVVRIGEDEVEVEVAGRRRVLRF